ncbi:MAG: hypothetical protein WA814_05590, partial [Candidatus Baltobacteraceae bacterium]
MQSRSSVRAEIGWLVLFLAIFGAIAYLFVRLLVPHHFNDRIAIALAALFAGLIMIALRARLSPR